jgi:hypothetical protein
MVRNQHLKRHKSITSDPSRPKHPMTPETKSQNIVPWPLSCAPMMDGTVSLKFPYYSEGFAIA